ncbi:11206_t:CDS:10, partial [Acaulospora morrowiae]
GVVDGGLAVTNEILQREKGCTHEGASKWAVAHGCCNSQFHTPKEEVLPAGFSKGRRVAHTRAPPNGGSSWGMSDYFLSVPFMTCKIIEFLRQLDLEQNLISSERESIHREYTKNLMILSKDQNLPQFARDHAKKLKKELSSKEVASFWDLILEREKLRATAAHDYTLLQQVRAKHVAIGITDVSRVQQNNEVDTIAVENMEGEPSNVRMIRKRKPVDYSELDSDTSLKYSENKKQKSNRSKKIEKFPSIENNIEVNHFPLELINDNNDNKNDNDENDESEDNESESNESEVDEIESEAIVSKLDELKKQLKSQSRNEWIVGTINVSRKFKEYQLKLIENIMENVREGIKITWDNKYDILALASIIVLIKPCPYSTFTPDEWKQVVNTNPYAVKEPIWTKPFASSLIEACINIAMGLDGNFVSNDENNLSKKASRIFNNLKEDLTSAQTKKITENEHRFYYLDPLLRSFFCGDSKYYKVRLDKSVKGSLKRPDFSCRVDDITILNSEVKPLGCTELQKNKDFIKVQLRSKKSINQLLNEGGPNQAIILLNMGDDVNSYIMDLQYDAMYRSWPLLATKLVTEKALFPLLILTIFHFDNIEQQVQRIANEYFNRSNHHTPPEQIDYIIEEPNSSGFKELLS